MFLVLSYRLAVAACNAGTRFDTRGACLSEAKKSSRYDCSPVQQVKRVRKNIQERETSQPVHRLRIGMYDEQSRVRQ